MKITIELTKAEASTLIFLFGQIMPAGRTFLKWLGLSDADANRMEKISHKLKVKKNRIQYAETQGIT